MLAMGNTTPVAGLWSQGLLDEQKYMRKLKTNYCCICGLMLMV
jgi:hypothetical protein